MASLLVAACAPSPPPGFEDDAARLEACPAGDQVWRDVLARAQSDDRVADLLERARRLGSVCADAWQPLWTEGKCLRFTGDEPAAGTAFEAALGRARLAEDAVGIASCENDLAWHAYLAGSYEASEQGFARALEAAVRADRQDLRAFVHNNLSIVLVAKADFAGARDSLERAARELAGLGRHGAARAVEHNRAVVLLELGDAVHARELLERLHREAAEAGDRWALGASAIVLGNLHLVLGEADAALDWYALAPADDPELTHFAALGTARARIAQGRFEEARARLDRAVAETSPDNRMQALVLEAVRAEARMRSGDAAGARTDLEGLVARSDEIGAEEPGWISRWLLGQALARLDLQDEALRVLREATDRVEGQRSPLDPLGDGLHFLRGRADLYVDLAASLAARGELEEVLQVIARAKARALGWAWRQEGTVTEPPPALAEVRRALGPGELLLDYLVGEDRSVMLAITGGTARARVLPGRRDFLGALRAHRDALIRPHDAAQSADREAGVRLRRDLLGSVDDLLERTTRLYVVPDRDLALLPFASLPAAPTGAAGYLGDRLETAVLARTGPPPAWGVDRRAVLLAGQPSFAPEDAFAELPWAAYELSHLRELWGADSTTYLGAREFSARAFRALALDRFGIVHLATHAVASTRDPRQCGIVFSGGEILGFDEIAELSLDAGLVVLSACRTGEGELLPGEGVIGLGWAFLRAGARAVVASRFGVDDAASARLMVAFHRELREGSDPVRALALARREIALEHPEPSYWAAFEVVLRPRS